MSRIAIIVLLIDLVLMTLWLRRTANKVDKLALRVYQLENPALLTITLEARDNASEPFRRAARQAGKLHSPSRGRPQVPVLKEPPPPPPAGKR